MPRTRHDLKVRGGSTPGTLVSAPQVIVALEPWTCMTREAVRVSIQHAIAQNAIRVHSGSWSGLTWGSA
jgi:hypothetical protein